MSPHPNFWRFFAILHFHLRLVTPSGLFPSGCPPNPWTHLLSLPYENLNTFYLLWNEKQNVICIETMTTTKLNPNTLTLILYPFLICPVCTFFLKLKIGNLNCARGIYLCMSGSFCNKPTTACSSGRRFAYLVKNFKTLFG